MWRSHLALRLFERPSRRKRRSTFHCRWRCSSSGFACSVAAASEAPLAEELDAPVVEWFHGEGDDAVLEALERRASAGESLLHWRLNADQTGSDFPNDDARLRADALGIVDGPAVAVNGRVLPDLDQATLESALNEAEYRRVLAFEGTVSMVEADGEAAVLIRGTVRPLENLSEHVIVLVTLTEDEAVDRHGRTATHLVRDMRPEVAFARDVGNSSDVLWTMTPDHLEAAGVDLSAQSLVTTSASSSSSMVLCCKLTHNRSQIRRPAWTEAPR